MFTNRTLSFTLTLSFIISFCCPIHASNFYLGAGYGVANFEGKEVHQDDIFIPGQRIEGTSHFAQVYAGWNLTEKFALELGYADYESLEGTYTIRPDIFFIVAPNDQEKVEFSKISLKAKTDIAIHPGFSLLLSGGYAYFDFDRYFFGGFSPMEPDTSVRSSEQEHALEVDIGLRYEISDSTAVRVSAGYAIIEDYDIQSNQVALEFEF